jgi:pectate lyase
MVRHLACILRSLRNNISFGNSMTRLHSPTISPFATACVLAALVSACGGGSSDTTSTSTTTTSSSDTGTTTTGTTTTGTTTTGTTTTGTTTTGTTTTGTTTTDTTTTGTTTTTTGSTDTSGSTTSTTTSGSTSTSTSGSTTTTTTTDASLDVAPASGWASQGGGTSGGSAAASGAIYTVTTATQLKAALSASGTAAKIIKVSGTIDMTAADNGGAFTSASDQASRNKIALTSNTTLIGIGSTAGLLNATVIIKKVSNVIVRNLTIVNPCDIAPVWDADDGDSGNWNSAYDGITVEASTNVWIDHNHFTDAPVTDDLATTENGKLKQCHDGAVDVKSASDYVTVSYNLFEKHDKNNLIGSSDSSTGDSGHLTVTFHHNWFSAITQRAPRVRFGQVHVYNNYYEGSTSDAVYPTSYSIGVGYKAQVLSEANVFAITGAKTCADVVTNPGSSSKSGAITDTGSLLNGASLALSTACSFTAASWTIPYTYTPTAAAQVKTEVTGNASVGHLTVK